MKGKSFKLIQDSEAAVTSQLKIFKKKGFLNCFRVNRVNAFKVQESTLKGINGNMFFTIVIFYKCKHSS